MKINTLAAIVATGLALGLNIAPAVAETSTTKGQKLCEEAAAVKFPDAQDINIDKGDTRSTDAMLWFTLLIKKGDGPSDKVRCTVDRAASKATVYAS